LIGTHFRDFQFNIVSCVVSVVSAVANQSKQCVGNTISFGNQSASSSGVLNFLWDFGDPNVLSDTSNAINPTYTYQDTGIYVLTLIANPRKPCTDTAKKMVYVYPPLSIDFKPPQRQCFKNNSFQFKAEGVYLPEARFTWDFTSKATPSLSQAMNPSRISFTESGLYLVKLLAKQFACRDSAIDSVRVLQRPQAKIDNSPINLCDPATVTFSNGSISDLPLKYYWRFSNGKSSNGFEPTQRFSPAGNYTATLTVISQSVCIDTNTTYFNYIYVKSAPVAGFTVTPDVTSIFDPEINVYNKASYDAVAWNYYFGDGQMSLMASDRHIYNEPGNFVITQIVTNVNGCSDTARHDIVVYPEFRFWIPNTFTPDYDNLNDVFKPNVIGVINYSFEIFNRWGEKIFETSSIDVGWNGTYKGVYCCQGIYAWRIRFKNIAKLQNEERIGHVLILRNL
jgi:gliding motility-associated-like protein